jgi:cell division protease FtsH
VEIRVKQAQRSVFLWAVLVAVAILVVQLITAETQPSSEIPFSTFRKAVEMGAVSDVVIHDNGKIEGKIKPEKAEALGTKKMTAFETMGRVTDDLQDLMSAKATEFRFKRDEPSMWGPILSAVLPMLFVFAIFYFFMRQMQGGGKAMSFGKSKARLLNESNNKVTFEDISGVEEAKQELQEIVEFLRDPKKFTRLGGRIPKGVLLMGPPGTGKTLLARGVAGEAGVPFFTISGSDFVEMFVGVGASRVRDLFEQGKKQAPCIIFIDEIDAVGRHRGAGMGGGHDEREQTLNQLLVEMDGFESSEGVILIAATNRPDVLDPALLRPGRFDRRVVVPRPDCLGREGILKVHTRKTPLAPNVDINTIAKGTPGFAGADLENLVNEAALIAARKGQDRLEMVDFEDAKDKVMMGAERRSAIISDRDKKVTAYHEAGHALVAIMLPQGRDVDPLHKVTIIPRGRALGVTQQLPTEDRLNVSKDWALNRIAIAMGGRAAEEIVFGQITTGAGQDLEHATGIARKMVCEWGMSDKIGPQHLGDGGEEVFLGRDYNRAGRSYSEKTAIEVDEEVRKLLQGRYADAKQILEDNKAMLIGIAEALLEFESIDGDEVNAVVHGNIEQVRKNRESARAAAKAAQPATAFHTKDAAGPRAAEAAALRPASGEA